jgi:universal stress protein A
MSTYQHVLLALDYSRENSFVAKKAQLIATQNQAKLSIVHVIEYITGSKDNMMDDFLDEEQMTLETLADDLGVAEDNRWLRAGIPIWELLKIIGGYEPVYLLEKLLSWRKNKRLI